MFLSYGKAALMCFHFYFIVYTTRQDAYRDIDFNLKVCTMLTPLCALYRLFDKRGYCRPRRTHSLLL